MSVWLGADTGGTHTDLVLIDEDAGRITTMKVPTTPGDLGRGIAGGIRAIAARAGSTIAAIDHFVYGTTLVTNLIVEEKASRIGLITTDGFRDVLEIGRAVRKPNVYDIHWRPAAPLVARELRFGVPERIAADGSIIEPLDEAEAERILDALAEAGVENIAICLLHSYANPVHEKRLGEIARGRHPGLSLSLSCDVVREFREFERTSTTVVNAFVTAPMVAHLNALSTILAAEGMVAKPFIIRGNGGLMSFEAAKALPAAMTHSGPMGGIVGGAAIAKACGLNSVITLDMGGTSADISLITEFTPVLTTRSMVGPHPLLLPMLDLVTLGAGGGSIAWIDNGNALRVGPQSAGAAPGPACYGAGGRNPTVTDANLFAGRLNPGYFLDGARGLDSDAARVAIAGEIAEPLGVDVDRAALGIIAIAEAHMVNGIRRISVDRGVDPRGFTLIGFGGAGPLHAARLAEELGMTEVLIPPAPGNLSAQGMLLADIRHDFVRTRIAVLDAIDPDDLRFDVEGLVADAASVLEAEGVAVDRRSLLLTADLRYHGQNYHLNIPVGMQLEESLPSLAARFNAQHRRIYGYDLPEQKIQFVSLRVAALGAAPGFTFRKAAAAAQPARPAARRPVLDGSETRLCDVYRFGDLEFGHEIAGPAIVEYPGSTLFIPTGWQARIDAFLNARLSRDA